MTCFAALGLAALLIGVVVVASTLYPRRRSPGWRRGDAAGDDRPNRSAGRSYSGIASVRELEEMLHEIREIEGKDADDLPEIPGGDVRKVRVR